MCLTKFLSREWLVPRFFYVGRSDSEMNSSSSNEDDDDGDSDSDEEDLVVQMNTRVNSITSVPSYGSGHPVHAKTADPPVVHSQQALLEYTLRCW